MSQPEFQCVSPLIPQHCLCSQLGGLEGCSGGHGSSLVLLRAECDFSSPVVSPVSHVPVLRAPFDSLVCSPLDVQISR